MTHETQNHTIVIDKNLQLTGAQGRSLLVDVYWKANAQAKPVVVWMHGFKGFKDWGPWRWVGIHWAENDLIAVFMNFSHNGTTPDTYDEIADEQAFARNKLSYQLADLKAVLEWIRSERFIVPPEEVSSQRKVALVGHSMGGGLAIVGAAEFSDMVAGVVAWAPVSTFFDWRQEDIEQWKQEGVFWVENKRTGKKLPLSADVLTDWLENKERFSPIKRIGELTIPVMLIHGTADESVPVSESQKLQSAGTNVTLHLIDDANHTFGGYHPYWEGEMPPHLQQVSILTLQFLKQKVFT